MLLPVLHPVLHKVVQEIISIFSSPVYLVFSHEHCICIFYYVYKSVKFLFCLLPCLHCKLHCSVSRGLFHTQGLCSSLVVGTFTLPAVSGRSFCSDLVLRALNKWQKPLWRVSSHCKAVLWEAGRWAAQTWAAEGRVGQTAGAHL